MKIKLLISIIFLTSNIFAQVNDKYVDPILFMKYLNEYRYNLGLNTLVYDVDIEKAAKIQTEYNHKNKQASLHENINYPHNRDRLKAVGLNTLDKVTGEVAYAIPEIINQNISKGFDNMEKKILDRYIHSPIHDKSLKLGAFTRMGMYTIYDGKSLYSVTVFMSGKPQTNIDVTKSEADSVVTNQCNIDRMIKLINEYRKSVGVKEVVYNKELEKAAKLQAVYGINNFNSQNFNTHLNIPTYNGRYAHYHPKYNYSLSRLKYLYPNSSIVHTGEIIIFGDGGLTLKETRFENNDENGNLITKTWNSLEEKTLETFKKSKGHNAHLIHEAYTQVGTYFIHDKKSDNYVLIIVLGYNKGEY